MSEEQKNEGKFEIIRKTQFSALEYDEVKELPESDLCFQSENAIYQFKYKKPEEEKKFEIEPGIYVLADTNVGVRPQKTELRSRPLLDKIDNTSKIVTEARTFFSRLHVYERLEQPKRRAVLLASKPGLGKSAAIVKFCKEFVEEDAGTVVLNWPTSEIEPESMAKFLSVYSEYTKECTRLILIMEDIGGGERDGEHGRSAVTAGLLNLLDGVGVTFKLPTFIIATTNYPENLLESLADRPGRFDLMLTLNAPSHKERVDLLEFIAKRTATQEEKDALNMKGTENFSIAHINEIIVRSELHEKSIPVVIKELIDHTKKFTRAFAKERQSGFGLNDILD